MLRGHRLEAMRIYLGVSWASIPPVHTHGAGQFLKQIQKRTNMSLPITRPWTEAVSGLEMLL